MSMTVKQALETVRHFLSGAEAPEGIQLVNDAGQYLHTLHTWRWASGQSYTLPVVAGQAEYVVPDNVRDVLKFLTGSRTYVDVCQVPWEELVRLEQHGAASPGWYTVALRYDAGSTPDDVEGTALGHPRPVLRVWPVPSTTEDVQMLYRRGWTDVRRDDDVIGLPDWMHPLFDALLRAFAKGRHEDDAGALHKRLDDITGSPGNRIPPSSLYINTRSRDGSLDGTFGPPRGGAARPFDRSPDGSRAYPGVGVYVPPPR